jgi:hypothetical protein
MRTAKYNAVPGCPRVDVLSIDYDKAAVRSNEAEPGQALLIVPVADLSSFEELAEAVPPDRQALLNIRQALREGLTPAQIRDAAVAEVERVGLLL